jgi:RHS repeat-associated protein
MRKIFYINTVSFVLLFCQFAFKANSQNTVKPNVKAPNGFEVNSFTGNLYHQRVDMKMPAQGIAMEIVFSYNNTQRGKNWGLGRGWTYTYNIAYSTDSANNVTVLKADGRRDLFRKSGNNYNSAPGVYDTLFEYQPGKLRLNTKDGLSYYFDNASHKKITRITDRNSNSITIGYTDSLASSVTDGAGRSFSLIWDGGKLAQVQNNCTTPVRKLNFLYDTAGNQVKVTRPDSSSIVYYYDNNSRIIGFTDELGNNMSVTYNANGVVSKIVSCATTQLFSYSPTARKTFVTELVQGQRQITTYSYDTTGRVIHKEGNCCGYNMAYKYDNNNNVIEQVNGNNNSTRFEYDGKGNVVKETNALGNIATYTWQPVLNKLLSVTDKRGNTTSYEYDANGNQTRIVKPLGVTEEYTYDARGNILTMKDANANITTNEYNSFGKLTKTTDALGGIVINTYDGCGNLVQVKDANNNITSFEYDAMDRLKKMTDALGYSTTYIYDLSGNVTGVTDAMGRLTRYQYDGLGRRIRAISPSGYTSSTEYDERNNRTKVTDANGNSTYFTYNSRNQVLTEKDALGNTKTYDYDGTGNLLSETDKRGNTSRYEYDKLNRLVKVTNANGNASTFSYDANGNRVAASDFNGNTSFFSYDALNRLIVTTDPLNKTIAYTYDGNGNVLTQKDKNNNIWSTVYDKLNREIKNTNPLTFFTETSYDANGNRLTSKNQLGHITTYTYDALNRLVTEINPLNEVISNTYDSVGNIKTISYPNGNTVTNVYNAENRLVAVTDAIGPVASYTYDANGNKLTEKDGMNNTTSYQYDALNRVKGVTDPLGNTAYTFYDANGNVVKETDRNGNSKLFDYDKLNRRSKETDALGYSTQFEYDGVGNRTRIIDAKNNITSYNYDALNRLTRETYADGSNRQFTYDGNGNRKTRKDNNGAITTYTYDAVNQMIQRSYPGNNNETFSYDAAGRRLTANNSNATITFTYDNLGRMLGETLNGKTTGYAYNTAARTRALTYPGGRVITETKDQRDRLVSIMEAGSNVARFTYDLADRLTAKALGNGVTQNYAYDANSRVATMDCQPANVLAFQYTYDKEGNKLSTIKNHRSTNSEKYVYDNIYQLTGFYNGRFDGSAFTDTVSRNTYSYDALHNRKVSVEDTVAKIYTASKMNAYSSVVTNDLSATYSYDLNGNTLSDGVNVYEYDYENRLKSISGHSHFFYDVFGRKIRVTTGNETQRNFFNKGNRIEERISEDSVHNSYVFGAHIDELMTSNHQTNKYWYSTNNHFSVLAIFDGINVQERYEYKGFGDVGIFNDFFIRRDSSLIGNSILFQGRHLLLHGMYDFRERIYSAIIGRFYQRDKLGYVNGFNLSSFVVNNPMNYTDPFGTMRRCCPGEETKSYCCNGKDIDDCLNNCLYALFGPEVPNPLEVKEWLRRGKTLKEIFMEKASIWDKLNWYAKYAEYANCIVRCENCIY